MADKVEGHFFATRNRNYFIAYYPSIEKRRSYSSGSVRTMRGLTLKNPELWSNPSWHLVIPGELA